MGAVGVGWAAMNTYLFITKEQEISWRKSDSNHMITKGVQILEIHTVGDIVIGGNSSAIAIIATEFLGYRCAGTSSKTTTRYGYSLAD